MAAFGFSGWTPSSRTASKGACAPCALAWVEKKLAEPFAGQTTILMHHPPGESGLTFFDNIGLREVGRSLVA
ncbi:MAG: hypothetical protein IPI27_13050 [Betaproteobacteria bacterium]|nr:hypothetical protein [Betaproteobacteria bacterium]